MNEEIVNCFLMIDEPGDLQYLGVLILLLELLIDYVMKNRILMGNQSTNYWIYFLSQSPIYGKDT